MILEYLYIKYIYFQFQNTMKKIKAFTMIEILIISIVISTWLFAIFTAANHAKLVNQRIMQTIIANQLATEWTEIVYQTRNTNLLKYDINKERSVNVCINTNYNGDVMLGYKPCLAQFKGNQNINDCRLATDYEKCINRRSLSTQLDAIIINTWTYYIETNTNWKNTIKICNETWCDNPYNPKYAICLNSWVRTPCPEGHELWWDESRYWKFFRVIEWKWLYDMSRRDRKWWQQIIDISLTDRILCNGIWCETQEFRFCSRVYRAWWQDWEIEICSTMTNFIE